MATSDEAKRGVGRPPDAELRENRKRQILEAATRVFAKHGFGSAADVQEIADLVGIGKGTVYRYFPSKEELFLATVDHGIRRLKASVDEAVAAIDPADTSPLAPMAVGVRAYLRFFDENPEVTELLIHERAHFRDRAQPTYYVHREANIKPWQDLFRHLIETGVIRNVPVERTLDYVSDMLYGSMFTNYFSGRKTRLSDQSATILDLLFNGLLVERNWDQ
ncbi:MAG TPA: TetR/AcrR family transcriptional regulator [Pirellulaceae bacterium]|nr:TetR/AcrR family transcriptional regulator [Pirellulaceae bacterium]HMO92128.1 TetR/AcrR family transcriptional regulator [Pirellulaceae bacterium]HMP69284.1 TetR/AcrR family transcriptional regulator [Pirellulaceae bacterium]